MGVGKRGGRGPAYHVGVAIEGVDMLGEFLNWVFGEDTEATANDATERQILINSQKQGEKDPVLFLPFSFPCICKLLFSLLLGPAPEYRSK